MKKVILAALVLGCVAGVHAEGDATEGGERKIVEAPVVEQAPDITRSIDMTPEQAPEGTRQIVEAPVEQAPAEEA